MVALTDVREFLGHRSVVQAVAVSPDGDRALTGSHDGTIRHWDIETGQLISTFNNHGKVKAPVKDVYFTATGQQAIVSNWGETGRRKFEDAALLIDLNTGEELQRFPTGGAVLSMDLSLSNRYLLTSAAAVVMLWDLRSSQRLFQWSPYHNAVVRFHPDEDHFFVGTQEKIYCFQLSSAAPLTREYHGDGMNWIIGMAISPDGQHIAACGIGIGIWNADRSQPMHRLYHSGKPPHVRDVAISPDGKLLASVGEDKTVRLWDLRSDREIAVATNREGITTSVVFSPDGTHLFTGGWSGSAHLWRVEIDETDA